MPSITSFQNARIKSARKLLDKRPRIQEARFLIDDARDLERALAHDYVVDFALYCAQRADAYTQQIADRLNADDVYEVAPDLLDKAAYRQNSGGLIAVMHSPEQAPLAELQPPQHLLVLADLRKPGNIGALMRSADAAGVGAILLVDTSLDRYNPNIIRSSTGACFARNIYYANTQQALEFLRQHAYRSVAGHLNAEHSLFEVAFTQRTAMILGTEETGLNELWSSTCDELIKIPMMGQIADSLNVSVSGAIMMYEALRQRLSS